MLDSLRDIPQFIYDGYAYVSEGDAPKPIGKILDVHSGLLAVIWKYHENGATMVRYYPSSAPHVIGVEQYARSAAGSLFVRVPDGAEITTSDSCGGFVSGDRYVIAQCNKPAGRYNRALLEAFEFKRLRMPSAPEKGT